MAKVLKELRDILGVGSRSNKWRMILNSPHIDNTYTLNIMAKDCSIPTISLSTVEIFNQGRKIIVPRNVTYENTFQMTFLDNEKHNYRSLFLAWISAMDNFHNNKKSYNHLNNVFGSIVLQQLSTIDNSVKAIYRIFNIFPSQISELKYDDEQNKLNEFTVTFTFSHFNKDDFIITDIGSTINEWIEYGFNFLDFFNIF